MSDVPVSSGSRLKVGELSIEKFFENLETDAALKEQFLCFVRDAFLEEFWVFRQLVTEFRKSYPNLSNSDRHALAKSIYNKCILPGSEFEINVSNTMQQALEDVLNAYDEAEKGDFPLGAFEEIQHETDLVLGQNILTRRHIFSTPTSSVSGTPPQSRESEERSKSGMTQMQEFLEQLVPRRKLISELNDAGDTEEANCVRFYVATKELVGSKLDARAIGLMGKKIVGSFIEGGSNFEIPDTILDTATKNKLLKSSRYDSQTFLEAHHAVRDFIENNVKITDLANQIELEMLKI